MNIRKLFFLLLLLMPLAVWSQEKAPMTFNQLLQWNRITESKISADSKWVTVKFEPWRGDSKMELYSSSGNLVKQWDCVQKSCISEDSKTLFVFIAPTLQQVEQQKLQNQKSGKKDNKLSNKIVIVNLASYKNGKVEEKTIDSVKQFMLSNEASLLAYTKAAKDSNLYIVGQNQNVLKTISSVKTFGISDKTNDLYYTTKEGLYTISLEDLNEKCVKQGKGSFEKPVFSDNGNSLAFYYLPDKKSPLELYLYTKGSQGAEQIITQGNQSIPQKWQVSKNSNLHFSKSGNRLFFGTAPAPREKDSSQLAENRPNVQIWNWNEPVQYTEQDYSKDRDSKRSYTCMYDVKNHKITQIANTQYPSAQIADEYDGDYALLRSNPLSVAAMWEGYQKYNTKVINLKDLSEKVIETMSYTSYRLSPKGNYAYSYSLQDSSWLCVNLENGEKYALTNPRNFEAWDNENDVPDYPSPYGIAGWSKDDKAIYIYDRYDIYKFSPQNQYKPVNLTQNGKENGIQYRLQRLSKEEYINTDAPVLLSGFNENTMQTAIYSMDLNKAQAPQFKLGGDCKYTLIEMAKNSGAYIYSKESFEQYPDIWIADKNFKKSIKLSNGQDQQKDINWGTAELVEWISLSGQKLKGVVYKPANFDSNKKYPLICSFYERNSTNFYNYRMPEPHRSTIDYHFYTSNGYIVFNPDIRYVDGYPGQSCYNCLMPGVAMLIQKGYIDEKRIGAQGHSWGGYQVSYLATRTSLFAAIESGAPVVNMFSAYGGIRWGSGKARAFQYEHTQSRLAATPWSSPQRYFENSALFSMDKVTTPILIMHNDMDGHVPWYQGIEYFVALKRLQKPAWLLNYTGEPHWPTNIVNKFDFQQRMFQFFEHFLNNKAMPKWMEEGVKAVDKDYDLGY